MEYTDYYKVLGVGRDAKQAEIKRAYRKLARKYHPDVSEEKDAAAKFKEVGEAYAVLKDPEKRAAYDQLGANWKAGQDFRPPPGWDQGFEYGGGFDPGGGGGGGVDPSQFSDFFESLFGGRGGRGGPRAGGRGPGPGPFRARGNDHHAKIAIDLEDAYTGATRALTLRGAELTDDGRVTTKERTLNVRIPKGIKQGQQIRLAGQGEPGIGGSEAGDLYLEVDFNPHRHYRVEGADVHLDLPVAPWEAALGASIKVPTPSGHRGPQGPGGLVPGADAASQGPRDPGEDAGRPVRRPADRPAASRQREGEAGLRGDEEGPRLRPASGSGGVDATRNRRRGHRLGARRGPGDPAGTAVPHLWGLGRGGGLDGGGGDPRAGGDAARPLAILCRQRPPRADGGPPAAGAGPQPGRCGARRRPPRPCREAAGASENVGGPAVGPRGVRMTDVYVRGLCRALEIDSQELRKLL